MDMVQVFKITGIQNIDDLPREGLFEFFDCQTLGSSIKLKKPRVMKSFRLNCFCVRSINGWNTLPDDIVNCNTVLKLKTLYDRYMGDRKFLIEDIY